MNGEQLRNYIERRGMKATPFTEKVVAAYLAANGGERKSGERHVKRWFAVAKLDEEIRPGPKWRAAVREVLGDDPFEAPSPWALQDLLEELRAMVEDADEERLNLRRRLDALEAARASVVAPSTGQLE